jgi:hypothetical protein
MIYPSWFEHVFIEALAFHSDDLITPTLYSLILDECDEVARDYAIGFKENTKNKFMKNSIDD